MPMLRCQGGLGPGHGSGVVGHPRGGKLSERVRKSCGRVRWISAVEHSQRGCLARVNLLSPCGPGSEQSRRQAERLAVAQWRHLRPQKNVEVHGELVSWPSEPNILDYW